ncbi:MAG: hypothetical protein ACLPX9_04115 [Rhodomicrobium sp.]
MGISFCKLAMIASGICMALAAIWIAAPQILLGIWQVDSTASALFMARRSGALFLGLGVMLWLVRHTEVSPARNAIATGLSVSSATLAVPGVAEFAAGHAGAGIWLAILVEAALAAGFYNAMRRGT